MKHDDAIEVLKKHLKTTQLFAYDFPLGPVTLTLRDGSFFCWYNALILPDKKLGAVYVFTEHYGYHEFDGEAVVWYSGPMKPKIRAAERFKNDGPARI